MDRRKFLKRASGLFVAAAPALILPKDALAQLAGGLQFPGPGTAHSAGGAFTPASLTGALVWLVAGVGQTLNGSNVNQWTDQISGINFTPDIPNTTSPSYSATGFNTSFPGITFVGFPTQHGLYSTASALVFGSANNTASFYVVANIAVGASNAKTLLGLLATGDTDENSGTRSVNIRYLTNPAMQVVQSSGQVASDTVATNTNYRLAWVFDGTNENCYFNNVLQASNAANFIFGASGSGNSGLGIADCISDHTRDLAVTIAEIVITKAPLTLTERNNLETYEKAKWGL